jgi:hypothetical protein
MNCSACGANAAFEDGFCTACGVEQTTSRLPVKRELRALPAIWRDAAPVVARGAALVAAGIAAEFLLRSMARGAVSAPSRRKKPRSVTRKETAVVEEFVAVTHTVVARRVIVKR